MKNLFLVLLILTSVVSAETQNSDLVKKYTNHENGVALNGYDPVSYFHNSPVIGNKNQSTDYKGITYFFSSSKSKETFERDPEKYIPVYGGWCAYAMANSGELVSINPETYKIIDGKLYLFYNAYFNNTLKKWNKNESIFLSKANINWENYLKRLNK